MKNVVSLVAVSKPFNKLNCIPAGDMFYKHKNILLSETICQVAFAVCRGHFQLTTICSQLRMRLFQAGFQHAPIFSRIYTFGQNSDNICNRK